MGYLDPDEMRKHMTPTLFRRWRLAAVLGLDIEGWRQSGELGAIIHNGIRRALYNYSGKPAPEDDLIAARDFIPDSGYAQDSKTLDEQLEALGRSFASGSPGQPNT